MVKIIRKRKKSLFNDILHNLCCYLKKLEDGGCDQKLQLKKIFLFQKYKKYKISNLQIYK